MREATCVLFGLIPAILARTLFTSEAASGGDSVSRY
jgi:hypothetical protein